MPDVIEPIATTSPLVRHYTLDEFFALPAPEGGGHYELIAGVLYMVPPPASPHYIAGSKVTRVLARYCDARPGGCTMFIPRAPIWTEDTYLEPDLFLIRDERLAGMDIAHLRSADLVVELLSPGSAIYDRNTKADTYAALGVAELWLVDPQTRTIEQRVLDGGRYAVRARASGAETVDSVVLDGLRVRPDDVFA